MIGFYYKNDRQLPAQVWEVPDDDCIQPTTIETNMCMDNAFNWNGFGPLSITE